MLQERYFVSCFSVRVVPKTAPMMAGINLVKMVIVFWNWKKPREDKGMSDYNSAWKTAKSVTNLVPQVTYSVKMAKKWQVRCTDSFLLLQSQIKTSFSLLLFSLLPFSSTLVSSCTVPRISSQSQDSSFWTGKIVSALINKTLKNLPGDFVCMWLSCCILFSITWQELSPSNSPQQKTFLSLGERLFESPFACLDMRCFSPVLQSVMEKGNKLFNSTNIYRKCHLAI